MKFNGVAHASMRENKPGKKRTVKKREEGRKQRQQEDLRTKRQFDTTTPFLRTHSHVDGKQDKKCSFTREAKKPENGN